MGRGAFVVVAGLAGCSEYEPVSSLPPVNQSKDAPVPDVRRVDRIVQVTTPSVDVLWTIDNSCSMSDEQDQLAANFPSFMDYFDGSGLDFHVGVVSTDLDDPRHGGRLQSGLGYKYIDGDTPSPVEVFAAMATLGTGGSGNEAGLGTSHLALERHAETYNAGFYRGEASLATIVISDEADHTPARLITQPEYVDWYDGLKREADERSFSCVCNLAGPDRGAAYIATSTRIGGIVWDITTEDWSLVLERLGIQASGLKREYFLSERPVPSTIVVEVEDVSGALLPPFEPAVFDAAGQLASGDYTYDPRRNSVTFLEYVPRALSTVILTYTLDASLQQAQTEGGGR